MTKRPPLEIGACYAIPLRDGRFGACQVLSRNADSYDVICLDWVGDAVPELDELASARVLFIDHHHWTGSAERLQVTGPPPPEMIALGVADPKARFDTKGNSYGFWGNLGKQLTLQHRWDHETPAAETRRYKEAIAAGNERIHLTIAGRDLTLYRRTGSVRIGPDENIAADLEAKIDWSQLDGIGSLTQISYAGSDTSVVSYARGRVLVRELTWLQHGQSLVDLSAAGLDKADVDVSAGPIEIRVSKTLERLGLRGYDENSIVTVVHPGEGRGLTLVLGSQRTTPPPVVGLERLSALELNKPRELDIRRLGYRELTALDVSCDHGKLLHAADLAELTQLRVLSLRDVYDMDPDDFPELGALGAICDISFDGLRKADAAVLKKRYRGVESLSVRGAKNDAWLRANALNPFNDWVDDDFHRATAACKAFKQASTRIAKLAEGDDAGLEKHMTAFVKAFNRIDAKHGIDTIQREEIWEAFTMLVEGTSFDPSQKQLETWFDERDF